MTRYECEEYDYEKMRSYRYYSDYLHGNFTREIVINTIFFDSKYDEHIFDSDGWLIESFESKYLKGRCCGDIRFKDDSNNLMSILDKYLIKDLNIFIIDYINIIDDIY